MRNENETNYEWEILTTLFKSTVPDLITCYEYNLDQKIILHNPKSINKATIQYIIDKWHYESLFLVQ